MRGDSSVRSSVSHMAMGDVMWRLVTAMLVTYGMSAVAWPGWCHGDALTESVFPLPHTNTHIARVCSQDHYPSILRIWGRGTTALELSVTFFFFFTFLSAPTYFLWGPHIFSLFSFSLCDITLNSWARFWTKGTPKQGLIGMQAF